MKMKSYLLLIALALSGSGCGHLHQFGHHGHFGSTPAALSIAAENPVLLAHPDHEMLWLTIIDVIDDDFRIQKEERPRIVGDILTEGTITTYPSPGATLAEPWRGNSVGFDQRLESTLQSIRRTAKLRVMPSEGGYLVEVQIDKELEDLERPENSTGGASTLRHDGSLDRSRSSISARPNTLGWIPLGRDYALEQRIIARLQEKTASVAAPYGIERLPFSF